MAALDLERELDRLYALPLAEFVAARNELAKSLRADGDREAAAAVRSLVKPSVTAWAANALYHRHRRRFDRLSSAATGVRAALAGKGDRKKAERDRREALRALVRQAERLLSEAGHAVTPAARQRISHTLEALTARPPDAGAPRPGRLERDLEPQGFDVLASLAASLAPAPLRQGPVRPAEKRPRARRAAAKRSPASASEKALAAARRELEERQAELTRLEQEADEADAELAAASARRRDLDAAAAEAERQAQASRKAAAAARETETAARAATRKAKAALRRARGRLETAQRKLDRRRGR